MNPVLQIRNLQVSYYTDLGRAIALDGASLTLDAGEKLGLVGESGSGKSTMALAMMRMIKAPEPKATRSDMQERAVDALESVDLKESVFRMYPHELSGGMKQRVCIAI